MGKLSKINTILNTVKYLKPVQIIYQLKGKLPNKDSFDRYPLRQAKRNINLFIPEIDFSSEYLKRFSVDEMLQDKVTLLHHTFKLFSWNDVKATHLQNFNLHYFEYLISLAYEYSKTHDVRCYDLIKNLLKDWEIQKNDADAKHPYTISLRIVNLLIVGSLLNDVCIVDSVYSQYRYLIKHQEKNLLGNHYFENLKTIVICSVVFDEEDIYIKFVQKLLREINKQILQDGVHYELSPMYHKIVLEGVIRTAYVLKQAEKKEENLLIPIIQRMITAMYSIEKGMGRTPLFNDSGDNVAKSSESILRAAKALYDIVPEDKTDFDHSGYYKLYDDAIAMMVDVGEIGPEYMPGHGQCDCLSFELSLDDIPVFVNSGTYQYQGELRRYFRSAKAHNTIMIGGTEQSEVWGEHRVARRIKNIHIIKGEHSIEGSYENYLNEQHKRKFLLNDSVLEITDSVTTTNDKTVLSYLHIADRFDILQEDSCLRIIKDNVSICTIQIIDADIFVHEDDELSIYAPEFGKILKAKCIEINWHKGTNNQKIIINFNNKGENKND